MVQHEIYQSLDDDNFASIVHCVFRRGASWFALPAVAVREVLSRPAMVRVPEPPVTFEGLCHVRSEFIPVVNLACLTADAVRSEDRIMLVLEDDDGPWGILVDEVTTLCVLEISDAPEAQHIGNHSAVVGWATHGDILIHVLELARVRTTAERELAACRPAPTAEISNNAFQNERHMIATET